MKRTHSKNWQCPYCKINFVINLQEEENKESSLSTEEEDEDNEDNVFKLLIKKK